MPWITDNVNIHWGEMMSQIAALRHTYPFLRTGGIGTSLTGRLISRLELGTGPRKIMYNASHHANEWLTTPVLMRFCEEICRAWRLPAIQELMARNTLTLVPMVNPDGVDLVRFWPNYGDPAFAEAARLNTTGLPLPHVWKANLRGVDLNRNYPAGWEFSRENQQAAGITGPSPRNFGGFAPLSEPETAAMARLTEAHEYALTMSYHAQGREIYWQFMDYAPPEAKYIGLEMAFWSGYTLLDTPVGGSWAGYKDWFLQEYRRPSYTIEVGQGVNPLPVRQFDQIYRENVGMLFLGLEA
jgi:g-D-glutamyl-meso-diaminopimelate peptidase